MNVKRLCIFLAAFTAIVCHAQTANETDSLSLNLQEIVVMARQPATKLEGSTLVTTIPGSSLQNLGNALDVLAQLPMIKVDNGAVSIIGRQNIEIYIDGHPMRDNQELQHLLSNNIKKVELQMAPGAMYESTTDAVLKITTRHNFMQGLSLSDQFEAKRNRKWSIIDLLDLNYRSGHVDIFVSGSINHSNSLIKGRTLNTLDYEGKKTSVGGSQHNSYPTNAGTVKTGFNYSKDKLSFGGYYRFNPEQADVRNTGTEWLNSESPIDRTIDKNIKAHSHRVSAYYDDTFADRYRLHFDGDFHSSKSDNTTETSYPDSSTPSVNSFDHKTSTLWAGKLYLNFPLCKGEFTVGTQETYTRTRLDFHMLNEEIGNYIPSSLTLTRQNSTAIFASWSRLFGRFSLSAGGRYEYTDYRSDIRRRDHNLTPDISLGYSFNEQAEISLSYKTTAVRPPYSQLTGALNYVGRHEIEGGNPLLKDERMHDAQVFGRWNDFILQADYIRSTDTYAFVKQLYPAPTLQLLMHPINIDVSLFSLYIIWSKTVKAWNPNITAGVYKQWLEIEGTHYNRPIFSYYFDNTISLPHSWLITANISGRSSGDMHTNRFGTTWMSMDASIGRTFLNKTLTVKLSATDIFNTANNDWSMNTFGIYVDKRQSYDHRGVSLNISYRFQPRKSSYKGESANEAELRRM